MFDFFDRNGKAVCYVTESMRLYSWDGRPLGAMKTEKVHDCSGNFIGWVKNGYLVGLAGECLLFTDRSGNRRGPPPPQRQLRPVRAPKQPFPEMADRQPAPPFPGIAPVWGHNPFEGGDARVEAKTGGLLGRLFGRSREVRTPSA